LGEHDRHALVRTVFVIAVETESGADYMGAGEEQIGGNEEPCAVDDGVVTNAH
jgi:hypothetical protein